MGEVYPRGHANRRTVAIKVTVAIRCWRSRPFERPPELARSHASPTRTSARALVVEDDATSSW